MRNYIYIFLILLKFCFSQNDWTQKLPSLNPSARYWHALSFIEYNKVLLFGGLTVFEGVGTDENDETWVYDLNNDTWSQKNPVSKPSARHAHSLAYIGDDIVLCFGGWDENSRNDETWVYDLSENNWTQMNPSVKPSARHEHNMAYIGDDKALLFGGNDALALNNETWIYDLSDNNWTQISPTTNPAGRDHHGMAYIGNEKVIMFGGYDRSEPFSYYSDTWVYDLSDNNWTQQTTSGPDERRSHSMAYIGGDQVLLFGGWDESTYYNDTWIFDLSEDTWTLDANTTQPTARFQHKISETSMDGSSYLVLFGGYDGTALNDETWTFGGGDYPLPVELISFNAQAGTGLITLNWTTASESNNLGFIIMRSLEKEKNYVEIDSYVNNNELKSVGNSSIEKQYTFIDNSVFNGFTYWYKLIDVDINGVHTEHGPVHCTPRFEEIKINPVNGNIPLSFRLYQNFPNPFNPSTKISFDIPALENNYINIKVIIYDILGNKIKTLLNSTVESGYFEIEWNGIDELGYVVPSGLYIYQFKSELFYDSKKMILLY